MRDYYNIVKSRVEKRPREVCANSDRIEHKLKSNGRLGQCTFRVQLNDRKKPEKCVRKI